MDVMNLSDAFLIALLFLSTLTDAQMIDPGPAEVLQEEDQLIGDGAVANRQEDHLLRHDGLCVSSRRPTRPIASLRRQP